MSQEKYEAKIQKYILLIEANPNDKTLDDIRFEVTLHQFYPITCRDIEIGCECPVGWRKIVECAISAIEEIATNTTSSPPQVVQIKQKYGTLRIYMMSEGHPDVSRIIDLAEKKCHRTCTKCGDSGIFRTQIPWGGVLCDHHYEIWVTEHI